MPLPSSRMTKQPARPTRYFPGKALAEDPVSDDESDEESNEEEQAAAPKTAAPKATSFPKKLAVDLSKPNTSTSTPAPKADDDLEGFVTASESEDDEDGPAETKAGSGSDVDEDEDDSSEEEDSSSDDEPKRPMLAPKFISKAKRAQQANTSTPELDAEKEESLRKEKADALLQAQIEKDIALRAAGKKNWDDDDIEDEVDDTDDLDPEAERAAWKLRELKRVKRDREALIAKEKEREEVERRRNMTAEEREAADREYIAAQEEEREGKGKMGFMQKYFHKGAFFNEDNEELDEEVREALNRDTAGRKFVDDTGDKAVLPEYMRIRDMTRLGKKGRTRYKDLKSEDTGRWGEASGRRNGDFDGLDERFRPDERGGGERERTGANDVPVGERRRREDDGGRDEGKRPRYD